MKRNIFFILFCLIAGALFAQSNEVIDTLLGESKADFGRTAYMVLSAASIIDDSADVSAVMNKLKGDDWKGLSGKKADDPVSFDEYSFLLMRAFSMSGGVMYHFFPSKRYAYRELKYMGYLGKDTDPMNPVSGDDVVRILGYVLEDMEESE